MSNLLKKALRQESNFKLLPDKKLDIDYIIEVLDIRFYWQKSSYEECLKIISQFEVINDIYKKNIDIDQYRSDLNVGI